MIKYRKIFKSIRDNGSEFANLSKLWSIGIPVYFTHLYATWEKGTNECHNRMLRRLIPKGKSIGNYSTYDIMFFADKINNLPGMIFNYHAPEGTFRKIAWPYIYNIKKFTTFCYKKFTNYCNLRKSNIQNFRIFIFYNICKQHLASILIVCDL